MATAIEYGLIASLIAVAAVGAMTAAGDSAKHDGLVSLRLETTTGDRRFSDVVERDLTPADCSARLAHGEDKTWRMGDGVTVTSHWTCARTP